VLFNRCKQQHETPFGRQLCYGAIEMRLKFAGGGEIFGRVWRSLASPLRFALLAAIRRAGAIEREAKSNAHEPRAKAAAIAQVLEATIGAKQRFLRDVFGVGGIAQHAARDAEGERTALGKPLLEFAAECGGRGGFSIGIGAAGPARSGCTGWLGQSQLLHGYWMSRGGSPPCTATRRRDEENGSLAEAGDW
jgi:hypothetical protein